MSLPGKKTPYIAETFKAIGEKTGTLHTIRYWKNKIEFQILGGGTQVIHEGWKYVTSKGEHVNPTKDGGFELAATGEKLKRV